MSRPAFTDNLARAHVQGGEQVGGAVPDVVVRAPLDLAGAHRQHRRGRHRGLDLRHLIHAQHQRPVRRVGVQANDVAHLLHEQGVARELEGFVPVPRPREGAPDAADHGLAQAGGLGQ